MNATPHHDELFAAFVAEDAPSAVGNLLARVVEGDATALEADAAAAVLAGDPVLVHRLRAHLLISEALDQQHRDERTAEAFFASWQTRRAAERPGAGAVFLAQVRHRLAAPATAGVPAVREPISESRLPLSATIRDLASAGGAVPPSRAAALRAWGVGAPSPSRASSPLPAPQTAWATASVAALGLLALVAAERTPSACAEPIALSPLQANLSKLAEPDAKVGSSTSLLSLLALTTTTK